LRNRGCDRDGRNLSRWFVLRNLILLFPLVVGNAVALPRQEIYTEGYITPSGLSRAALSNAIALSANYLQRACLPSGRFIYIVDTRTGIQPASYNIVRHSGAIYALSMINKSFPTSETEQAMVRAARYLRANYIRPNKGSNELVVWSTTSLDSTTAELGASGLGLVALAAVRDLRPSEISLSDLQSLGRFILQMQGSDGSFASRYVNDGGKSDEFESLYYPGEAALGLLSVYEADHSEKWLYAAIKALSYLALKREGVSSVPPDQWALIATAKLFKICQHASCPLPRDRLVKHAIQICQSMIQRMVNEPVDRELDGAVDFSGRTTPVSTQMEGMLAALEFLPQGSLKSEILLTSRRSIGFLLKAQIVSGPYAGGMPGAVIENTPSAFDVRIDYVQHAASAWIRYMQIAGMSESSLHK
jgi:hypothetical protein